MSDLDPLRLFQEDLKDDDYEVVIQTINKLTTVAVSIGPTRVRNELVPFLVEYSETDNDEAQTSVARQLADFTDLVGGSSHLFVLLPLLEKLCGEEEFVVRDTAVQTLAALMQKLPKADVAAKFIPMLKRLANGDWFTTRVSAAGLFSSAYQAVNGAGFEQLQTELRSLFNNLCNDDTPMVRKAAFQQLGAFSLALQRQYFKSDIYPIIKAVAVDDMDSMRIYAIDACAALAKVVEQQEYAAVILPILEALQDDASWRVRQQLSIQFVDLCVNAIPDPTGKRLMPIFAKLLRDKEAEVRASAVDKLDGVCNALKVGVLESIAPLLEALATDSIQNVRVNFSRNVLGICPSLGKEQSAKVLIPILQQLTKDEYYEVRNNILSRLDLLNEAIGSSALVASVLPGMIELAKDPKWRVRMGVIEKLTLLAQAVGVKNFEKKLQPVIIAALSDHVYAIREIACIQMGSLVKEFGGKWAGEKLLPQAFLIYDKTTNYLHRMTCLSVIEQSAPHGGSELVEKTFLPLVTQACVDDVANVRIAAAKTVDELINRVEKKVVQTKIQPFLQKMITDSDPDVNYFANLAYKKCL